MRLRRGGRDRRRSLPTAEVRPLEARLLMDGGGAASATTATAPPSKFASKAELDQYLIDAAVAEYQSYLGRSFTSPIYGPYPTGGVGGGWAYDVGMGAVAASSTPGFSGTNDQVQGVGEGDIVQNDGQYLYILSERMLKIVDARDPKAPAVASTTALDGTPLVEYLNGSRLTVISRLNQGGYLLQGGAIVAGQGLGPAIGTPGIGYPSPQVKVSEFDVSDPTSPTPIRATTMDGNYLDSRSVGDRVHVVLQDSLPYLPGPLTHPEGDTTFYETEAEYRARLAALVPTLALPQESAVVGDGAPASSPLIDPTAIYKPATPTDTNLLVIASFDAKSTAAGPSGVVGVVAAYGSTVYATPASLYLFSPQYPVSPYSTIVNGPTIISTTSPGPSTSIRKFSMAGDVVALTSTGTVPGTVLDQFSADEQGGYLRVVTTEMPSMFYGAIPAVWSPPSPPR